MQTSGEQSTQLYMAVCPKGLEAALAKELRALGVSELQESVAAVYFSATTPLSYHVINWSRIANRIVLVLARERCDNLAAFDQLVQNCGWSDHFSVEQTIAVDFNGTNDEIRNIRYGAQRCKDGIQQQFDVVGRQGRIQVDLEEPEVRVYVRAFKNRYTLGLDLVGESLHRRGYRATTGAAPLKENLAAAILQIVGWTDDGDIPSFLADSNTVSWPENDSSDGASRYRVLFDPFCGSATFLIEAALVKLRIAPSYLRADDSWALKPLSSFDAAAWHAVREPIDQRAEQLILDQSLGVDENDWLVTGSDIDPRSISAGRANIDAAKLDRYISVRQSAVSDIKVSSLLPFELSDSKKLMLSNPPYGHRLGEHKAIEQLYRAIGDVWAAQCDGWEAALLNGNPELGFATNYRSWRQHKLFNGAIECQLQRYRINEETRRRDAKEGGQPNVPRKEDLSEQGVMLYNRLAKFRRRFKKALDKLGSAPYRIYDADLPEFNMLVDIYPVQDGCYVQLQEYEAPKHIDSNLAGRRLREAAKAVSALLSLTKDRVIVKQRVKQRGKQQYQKRGDYFQVQENSRVQCCERRALFWVDPSGYLDTGLFIDSRGVRRWLSEQASGKNVLNLFAYTGTASVAAALGGAKSTLGVDMSATYTEWAKQNYILNSLDLRRHHLQQADCIQWLKQDSRKFDLILLDPPSFSNSKRMTTSLDIQRDHRELIELAARRLTVGGQLLFCTNRRGFRLAQELEGTFSIKELTDQTLEFDCAQSRHAHRSWLITPKSDLAQSSRVDSSEKKTARPAGVWVGAKLK